MHSLNTYRPTIEQTRAATMFLHDTRQPHLPFMDTLTVGVPAAPPCHDASKQTIRDVTQTVVNEDCLAYMRTMATQSVAVVVTSPPYNLRKRYSQHSDNMPEAQYLTWQQEAAQEIARLLVPEGHLFLNVGSNSQFPWRCRWPRCMAGT